MNRETNFGETNNCDCDPIQQHPQLSKTIVFLGFGRLFLPKKLYALGIFRRDLGIIMRSDVFFERLISSLRVWIRFRRRGRQGGQGRQGSYGQIV